jgi:hypothetical protein
MMPVFAALKIRNPIATPVARIRIPSVYSDVLSFKKEAKVARLENVFFGFFGIFLIGSKNSKFQLSNTHKSHIRAGFHTGKHYIAA